MRISDSVKKRSVEFRFDAVYQGTKVKKSDFNYPIVTRINLFGSTAGG